MNGINRSKGRGATKGPGQIHPKLGVTAGARRRIGGILIRTNSPFCSIDNRGHARQLECSNQMNVLPKYRARADIENTLLEKLLAGEYVIHVSEWRLE